MTDTKEWTPDMPLRADATNEDFHARHSVLHRRHNPGVSWGRDEAVPVIAREYADARLAAARGRSCDGASPVPWRESDAARPGDAVSRVVALLRDMEGVVLVADLPQDVVDSYLAQIRESRAALALPGDET